MNQNVSLEGRLESFGAALRARPRLTERVMDEIRRSAADGSMARLPTLAPRARMRHRRHILTAAAGAIASIGIALFLVIALVPSPSVGWDDVTKAIQAQKWIRGTVTFPGNDRATMWLSPGRQIWAFKSKKSFRFFDGREQARYEYRGGDKPITKWPLGEDDAQRILPVDSLSQSDNMIGPWLFGTEKIVQQKRQDVKDAGKTWIEFQMVLWRGEMNQATLRVDPKTKLPVYLLSFSPNDATKFSKWEFDYPADGPTDIYALGVPRGTKIDDRTPSDDALRVLHAMAASRARIGSFRMMESHEIGLVNNNVVVHPGAVVSRKGSRWRVDRYGVPDGFDPINKKPAPLYVCDGMTVWENSVFEPGAKPMWQLSRHAAPQDLMSGEGLGILNLAPYVKFASLLFPDLSPKSGWSFEFDSKLADAPGCVRIKRSVPTTSREASVSHQWYLIDPAKGHAVVHVELFALPPGTRPEAGQSEQTLGMEDFRQSPSGFWYPGVIRDTKHAIPGDNQQTTTTVRYQFDFDVDLPDSLFTVDDVQIQK